MTWTAPEFPRPAPPLDGLTGDEQALADAWLDYHRATLLWKCGGLTAGQLRDRGIEPSGLSLLGLVRHMAEVERDWFRTRFAGQSPGYLYCTDEDQQAEFDTGAADPAADLAAYQQETEIVRQLIRGRPLDDTYRDPRLARDVSLRWVVFTMIQEYARHNGHADLLREHIDGSTGH